MSFLDIQLKQIPFSSYNSNLLTSVILYNSSSLSDSSTTFSGLPHVIEPQPQDKSKLILLGLGLVAHTSQLHCNICVHTLGKGSYSNSFGFNRLL